ncbi:MAG: hypothetical protein IJO71_12800 [Microbacterium sp.]|uniref:hypothetical protein n=1 Tax=Microbacterium sp. TaxID=51671 RepID=UPI0025E90B87|nr:hypothetical protein [Microbacterium sp.]MBQ9918062.1 hypothetical protein [Microbacterium sp.]
MERYETIAKGEPEAANSSEQTNTKGRKMTIARFAVPERFGSGVIERVIERLGSVGVESYEVELAGAGEPLLDLEDVTYVGADEIELAVDSIVAERRTAAR